MVELPNELPKPKLDALVPKGMNSPLFLIDEEP